jgi:putative ABC transport system permease protein
MPSVELLWLDIRYGLRALRKAPAFTAIAILALGLGIGADTAIFSIADAFLLKPLPLPDMDHLVVMMEQAPGQTGDDETGVSPANFLDWRRQTKTLQDVTIWLWDSVNLTGEGVPEKAQGYQVLPDFFSMTGVTPMLGRTFLPEESQQGNDGVVVLSYGLWERRFGSDPQLIGRAIHLDDRPYTVIGIMPKAFRFPITADLWLPLTLPDRLWARRDWRAFFSMGKLNPGQTAKSAGAEINAIESRLAIAYPSNVRGWRVRVIPIRRFAVGDDAHEDTVLLLVAVGFVLLLVCANIANLQFVRGAGRIKEIAIRSALGSSRWRTIRQLLTESVLIGLGGAVLGVLFAHWTIRFAVLNMPEDVSSQIAGWDQIRLDFRALAFTVAIAVIAGMLAGLLPALESARVNLSVTLKEGGRSGSSARGRHRLRSLLVILQVALAVILLGGAGLVVRTFHRVRDADKENYPDTLLTMVINLPASRYSKPDQITSFYDQVLSKMSALPGVQGAAASTAVPYAVGQSIHIFSIEGHPWTNPAENQNAGVESVSPNYFRLMGISLIRGREFTDQDAMGTQNVVLISRSLSRAYWADKDPIGSRVKLGALDDSRPPWLTIVGVVDDIVMNWTSPGHEFILYRPYHQFPRVFSSLFLRTSGNPESFVQEAGAVISSVDPQQTPMELKPMSEIIRESTINISYVAAMMTCLGFLSLALAAAGVYGVMAYTTAQATHEIGIRMAMGALPSNVLSLILRRGMLLTAAGLAIGIPIFLLLIPLLASYMSGIGSADPLALTAVSLILAAVALIACWIPARRATRVDPMVALRYE